MSPGMGCATAAIYHLPAEILVCSGKTRVVELSRSCALAFLYIELFGKKLSAVGAREKAQSRVAFPPPPPGDHWFWFFARFAHVVNLRSMRLEIWGRCLVVSLVGQSKKRVDSLGGFGICLDIVFRPLDWRRTLWTRIGKSLLPFVRSKNQGNHDIYFPSIFDPEFSSKLNGAMALRWKAIQL